MLVKIIEASINQIQLSILHTNIEHINYMYIQQKYSNNTINLVNPLEWYSLFYQYSRLDDLKLGLVILS